MMEKKISELTAASSIGDADIFPIVQDGETKKIAKANMGFESTANKVTSMASVLTDTQYPSAKLMRDELVKKQNQLMEGSNITIVNDVISSVSGVNLCKATIIHLDDDYYDTSTSSVKINPGTYTLYDDTVLTYAYEDNIYKTVTLPKNSLLLVWYALDGSGYVNYKWLAIARGNFANINCETYQGRSYETTNGNNNTIFRGEYVCSDIPTLSAIQTYIDSRLSSQ